MKKIKFIMPICSAAAIAGAAIPLSACSVKKTIGNLMTEYIPKTKQHETVSGEMPIDIVDEYLKSITDNPKIFEEDFIYTLSRGLPQYTSYISEFCEITKQDYDVKVYDIKPNIENQTITFTVDFHMYYDYSKTKREELVWYEMPYKVWDATTTVKMVFDFNTSKDAGFDTSLSPYAQMKQMTTFAGATQFGVCEKNSTMTILKEKGYCINVDDKRIEIDKKSPSEAKHFILPSQSYWQTQPSGMQTYNKIRSEVYDVWYDMPGAQIIVLLFKYYMPSNVLNIGGIPSVLDFGSYYMANATLDDTYQIVTSGSNTFLYGFNKSLDSERNKKHITSDGSLVDGTLTLPEAKYITQYAFDGNLCVYTNMGIPVGIDTVVIPDTYKEINSYAFALSPAKYGFKKIVLNAYDNTGDPGARLALKENAFNELSALECIDLSSFSHNYYVGYNNEWAGAFKDVHAGSDKKIKEGTIILPNDCTQADINNWISLLASAGIDAYQEVEGETHYGWVIEIDPAP